MSNWQSELIINPYVQEAIEELLIPCVNIENYGTGLTDEEISSICEDLDAATCYLIEFAQGNTDAETCFDAIEHYTEEHNTNIDQYLDTAINNLENFLECPQIHLKNQIENNPIVVFQP